jgi:proteasome activator subunit 4
MDTDTDTDKRDLDLVKLQRVNLFIQQLPYFDQIKRDAFQSFEKIKTNLTLSIACNELRPGFVRCTNQLIIYIHEFGLFFTKTDHLNLINLYLKVMLTPDIDFSIVDMCLNTLTELLHKYDKISRDELIIEWKPIYKLYLKIRKVNNFSAALSPENLDSNFCRFIKYARIYFHCDSINEIMAIIRPMFCPFDTSMSDAMERLKFFLPTLLYEHEIGTIFDGYLYELIHLWQTLNRRQLWECHLIPLMSRVAVDTIGHFNWNPFIPFIFSNILRGFGLPFGSKDSIVLGINNAITSASFNTSMSQQFMYSSDQIVAITKLIVAMIGTSNNASSDRNLCMDHIRFLFQALRSFYYPSNSGHWSSNIFIFLNSLPNQLIKRIKKQKREKLKWHSNITSQIQIITDDDITEFVNAMKDVTFTAIFSKSHHSHAKQAFQSLCFLRSDIMLPQLIDKIQSSFESLIEPHRYTSMLSCLVVAAREIATFNKRSTEQTQLQVIPLLCSVLPGLDPNDLNKFILTLHFLNNILSCVIVCDCTPAITLRNDLTDYERDLCYETAKFEDFVHELFRKVFSLIDLLASDTSNESSASAAAASTHFSLRNKSNSDENISQAFIIHTIKVIIF